MSRPDTIIIEGRAYPWRAVLELRQAQIKAWNAARLTQPALLELKTDCKPATERTAAGRYREPILLTLSRDGTQG